MERVGGRHMVVLLVEDDPGDEELTRRALEESTFDIDLRTCADGEEAEDYLLGRGLYPRPDDAPRPDLILLDLNLPNVDGQELLARIRGHSDLLGIAVVVFTTSDQDEDRITSYQQGAHSFVTKPMEADLFMKTIRTVVEGWFSASALPPGVA